MWAKNVFLENELNCPAPTPYPCISLRDSEKSLSKKIHVVTANIRHVTFWIQDRRVVVQQNLMDVS
jgi:hypothetical protein